MAQCTTPIFLDAILDQNICRGESLTLTANAGVLPEDNLVITAVFDGPLPGGTPKGVELYVINDINDLSAYGIGAANNGGGTDGAGIYLSGCYCRCRSSTFIWHLNQLNLTIGLDLMQTMLQVQSWRLMEMMP